MMTTEFPDMTHAAAALSRAAEETGSGFSDDHLASRFAGRHAGRLRYVAAWGRWLIWNGTVWQFDQTLRAFDLARAICRQASARCDTEGRARAVSSAKTVAAVERLAKADRRHAATVEQWDADPWLLNTPAGVVDLRTGLTRPHDPAEHMTKITKVAPGGECPQWLVFLARITDNDAELQAFLQRFLGYCLTGITHEHAMAFAYGTGANGKSVLLHTVTGIIGDYAVVAPMETFTATPNDRHPTDLAMLRGARLVTAQETEEGRRWAEAKIKALTGGDPITARFMRQDFFTFQPSFKLFIAGNHKPGLRGVDEAMRRRLNLVPFVVTIPAGERDPDLPEKLKAEWAGIMAWMLEGCLAWQREGLRPPAAVADATESYLGAEDSIGTWIAECCTAADTVATASSILFASWKAWSEAAGEYVGSQKRLAQALEARGFAPTRLHGGIRAFKGLSLRAEAPRSESGDACDGW